MLPRLATMGLGLEHHGNDIRTISRIGLSALWTHLIVVYPTTLANTAIGRA